MSGTEKSGHSARGREDEKMKKMSERQGEMRAGGCRQQSICMEEGDVSFVRCSLIGQEY